MTNEIQIFNNPQFGNIRTVMNSQNEPLFCLADVCKALDLTNCRSVRKRLAPEDVQLIDLHAVNPNEEIIGNSMANFVTESAMYEVVLQSCSPKVKPFKRWLTHEVIPIIRRTGGYMVIKENESPEETMARALLIAQDTINRQKERLLAAETKIIEDAPYVDYADEVLGAKSDLDMIQACRVLADNGVVDHKGKPLGRTNFFKILRLNKVLMMSNRPYQKWIDKGYFGTAIHTFFNGRVNKLTNVPLVKPEGLKWLLEMFKTNQFDLNIVP